MNFKFVGREGYYREGELYLLGQRWYDSEVGRFISRDPIGEKGGVNLYVYVGNNSVNASDPYGKIAYDCWILKYPNIHRWFEWDSGSTRNSCGFYPGGNIFGGRGIVESPEPKALDPDKICFPIPPPPGSTTECYENALEEFCSTNKNNPPRYIFPIYTCIQFVDYAFDYAWRKCHCQ
jgi:RHS repeat-associated protein